MAAKKVAWIGLVLVAGCGSASFTGLDDPGEEDAGTDTRVEVDAEADAGVDARVEVDAEAGTEAAQEADLPQREALHFDGVDDLVNLPADDGGANEQAFACELWFRTTQRTGVLFEVYADNGGSDRSLYVRDGHVCFYVNAFTLLSEVCDDDDVSDGEWHHAAGVLGPGGQHLRVDGALAAGAPETTSSAFGTDEAFRIGYGRVGPYGALAFFQGDLDEVRVWAEERNVSLSEVDPKEETLQGYWRLDGDASDATGSHDGVLVGFSEDSWISD